MLLFVCAFVLQFGCSTPQKQTIDYSVHATATECSSKTCSTFYGTGIDRTDVISGAVTCRSCARSGVCEYAMGKVIMKC
jgi:hypothetical protein